MLKTISVTEKNNPFLLGLVCFFPTMVQAAPDENTWYRDKKLGWSVYNSTD
jgi:hypothetical protein